METNENVPSKKTIFDAIAHDDLTAFKAILAKHTGSVDFLGEHGMTPLQHAAFKGNSDMVQLLIDRGADVNWGMQDHDCHEMHSDVITENCSLALKLTIIKYV